jgi:hypothetical protein
MKITAEHVLFWNGTDNKPAEELADIIAQIANEEYHPAQLKKNIEDAIEDMIPSEEEMNIEIAEWMGFLNFKSYMENPNGRKYNIDELKFHKSILWQKDVLEKIETLGYTWILTPNSLTIYNSQKDPVVNCEEGNHIFNALWSFVLYSQVKKR